MKTFVTAAVLVSCVISVPLRGWSTDKKGEPLLPRLHARLAAREPVEIVCLGDSVTGVYYHTGGRRAYAEMIPFALRAVFPEAQVTMVNAGISGNTTRDGLARLERDVLAHKPD